MLLWDKVSMRVNVLVHSGCYNKHTRQFIGNKNKYTFLIALEGCEEQDQIPTRGGVCSGLPLFFKEVVASCSTLTVWKEQTGSVRRAQVLLTTDLPSWLPPKAPTS